MICTSSSSLVVRRGRLSLDGVFGRLETDGRLIFGRIVTGAVRFLAALPRSRRDLVKRLASRRFSRAVSFLFFWRSLADFFRSLAARILLRLARVLPVAL